MEKRLFTSESVTEGHPDKISDQIFRMRYLDALMRAGSHEPCCLRDSYHDRSMCLVMGEITTKAKVDYEKIVRETIREIGYDTDENMALTVIPVR